MTPLTMRAEYKPFADVLRAAMTKDKLSASEVARRVWGTVKDSRGYDVARNRDRIGHYLAGASYPEPENLVRLADAVGLTVAELTIEPPAPTLPPRGRQPGDIQITVLGDQSSRARLQLDRTLSVETAMRIVTMIREDELKPDYEAPSGRAFTQPPPENRDPAQDAAD